MVVDAQHVGYELAEPGLTCCLSVSAWIAGPDLTADIPRLKRMFGRVFSPTSRTDQFQHDHAGAALVRANVTDKALHLLAAVDLDPIATRVLHFDGMTSWFKDVLV